MNVGHILGENNVVLRKNSFNMNMKNLLHSIACTVVCGVCEYLMKYIINLFTVAGFQENRE